MVPLKRIAVALAGLALIAATVMAVLPVVGDMTWEELGEGSTKFCQELGPWHEAQIRFLGRANESGAREPPGLKLTYDLFYKVGATTLPVARDGEERALREALRRTVMSEEQWMSEVGLYASLVSPQLGATGAQRLVDLILDTYQRQEKTRLELNELLRESNGGLQQVCGLPPLPLYSTQ